MATHFRMFLMWTERRKKILPCYSTWKTIKASNSNMPFWNYWINRVRLKYKCTFKVIFYFQNPFSLYIIYTVGVFDQENWYIVLNRVNTHCDYFFNCQSNLSPFKESSKSLLKKRSPLLFLQAQFVSRRWACPSCFSVKS